MILEVLSNLNEPEFIFTKGKEELGNASPVSLTSVSMKQILLETITRHVKGKKMTGDSHHGFGKHKSCPTDALTSKTTGSAAVESTARSILTPEPVIPGIGN